MLYVIILWIACGFICEYLGNLKGQKGCFLYGLLLGVIGVIIVLCLKDKSNEISNIQKNNNNTKNKYEQLKEIQELKEKGVLTEVEFENEKRKILG